MDYNDLLEELCVITAPKRERQRFASSSLRTLAIRTIKQHVIRFLLDGFKSSLNPSNPFKILPDTVRNQMLKDFTFFANYCSVIDAQELGVLWAIRWLLNSSTTEFKFPLFYNQTRYSDIWKTMTLNCPNLQKIEWTYPAKSEIPFGKMSFFTSLVEFKALQKISITEVECDDLDLCRLAANLPKLRSLDIELADSVSRIGFKALSKLEDLRELVFAAKPGDTFKLQFLLFMLFLPKLHYFQFKQNCSYLHQLESLYDCAFEKIRHSGLFHRLTLGLKSLILNGMANPPSFLQLPNLKTLCLLNPPNVYYPDDRLSKVTALSLHGADMNVSASILQQIGHQLSELSIGVVGTLTLNVVIKECPNLEVLIIVQDQQHISYLSHLNQGCQKTLKRLHVHRRDHGANVFTLSLQPGLLMKLLQFPNLQSVLLNVHLSQEEADSIIRAVQEKSILQLVGCFGILAPRRSEVAREYQDNLVVYKECVVQPILFSIANHCPNATDLW